MLLFMSFIACADYTPKPKGYPRIEPERGAYLPFEIHKLPFRFLINDVSRVEWEGGKDSTQFRIVYPELGAAIYCHYLPVTPTTLDEAEQEGRMLVARQAHSTGQIEEKSYSDPEARLYGSLFLLRGETASPVQFLLTDSVSHLFRGALYFNCKPNADSLAPAIQYIRTDIIELIQTFRWKRR